MKLLIKKGNILTPFREITGGGLLIKGGVISEVLETEQDMCKAESNLMAAQEDSKIIDAGGNYIAPGFIDIHTHGAGGHDFMDGTVEAILEAARAHMRHGTTSLVPTTLTSSLEDLFKTLDNFKKAGEYQDGPELLGIHLEGPYFSMEQRGAQDPRFIKNPDREEYMKILDYSKDIIRWTVAPELEGALAMGRELKNRGVLPSIGHSNAIYEDVQRAFENGFTHVTHLYSGMSMVRRINAYRYAGVVESAFLIDDMTVEIIADGKHLPQSLLKLIYKIKGPDRICLVTDSMRAAGMPDGEYILGSLKSGQEAIVEEGVAKLPDRSAFAGSVATADRLVKTMVEIACVPLIDAVRMMTSTPARIIGVADRKGALVPGKDADIIVFDERINIKTVITRGTVRFQLPE
ncbi:N-acetylglucosamine-6-phosphate deacetylase [Biomaibacter acetigenes]|uniref:N-acetylglucosamine-6-phosphate deacetylase n=1 Tax=Biomaibacter acetigenes TaxID=2316383 RepID=A0A3G2R6W0_9FIRM|nr:N-acetylglucosamine-6-phosphate deacetylase [Biomaibacter acetigenes]AYO31105.1 N-acetylglucosamine-6-phosphate deacetylase [Biomaibacter acetigenes]